MSTAGDDFGRCVRCKQSVYGKANGCFALGQLWHKTCFICADCSHSLYDSGGFFEAKGKVFCDVHFKEREAPRCRACSKAILDQILNALEHCYHPSCFRCFQCQTTLDGKPFVPQDEHIFCRGCWHEKFGVKCARCKQSIVPEGDGDARCMRALTNSYHMKCFSCEDCNMPFTQGQGAYPIQGQLFCREHAMQRARKAKAEAHA